MERMESRPTIASHAVPFGACAGASDVRSSVRAWLRGAVRSAIPHESALVLRANSHSLGFTIEESICIDLPVGYLAGILDSTGQIRGPLVERWMRTREVQYFERDQAWPGLDREWLRNFEAHGLRNCVFFGTVDAAASRATFLALYNLPRGSDDGIAETGTSFLEPLHRAMTRTDAHAAGGSSPTGAEEMTPAEREVLRWVRLGRTNTEIAMILGRSRFTVKTHIQRMLAKTGLDNRTQLCDLANRQPQTSRSAR
jgi:DNA-binding CsgD family transcriptional regulator